jgi:hypothetical protein
MNRSVTFLILLVAIILMFWEPINGGSSGESDVGITKFIKENKNVIVIMLVIVSVILLIQQDSPPSYSVRDLKPAFFPSSYEISSF